MALGAAIRCLGRMGGASALPTIGALLDDECRGLCDPVYCVWALEEIGGDEAVTILKRTIERHARSRKSASRELCGYAEVALEKIG